MYKKVGQVTICRKDQKGKQNKYSVIFNSFYQIIGGTTAANVGNGIAGDNSLWCGRSFNPASGQGSDAVASVCSKFPSQGFTIIILNYFYINIVILASVF